MAGLHGDRPSRVDRKAVAAAGGPVTDIEVRSNDDPPWVRLNPLTFPVSELVVSDSAADPLFTVSSVPTESDSELAATVNAPAFTDTTKPPLMEVLLESAIVPVYETE